MKITVKHIERNEISGDVEGFTPVAIVDASDFVNHDIEEALNYAFRYTNNVMGSWSIKEQYFQDGEANGDYNEAVTVMAPLHEGGMGLRSTSMGDQMLVGNKKYKVAMVGFEEIV